MGGVKGLLFLLAASKKKTGKNKFGQKSQVGSVRPTNHQKIPMTIAVLSLHWTDTPPRHLCKHCSQTRDSVTGEEWLLPVCLCFVFVHIFTYLSHISNQVPASTAPPERDWKPESSNSGNNFLLSKLLCLNAFVSITRLNVFWCKYWCTTEWCLVFSRAGLTNRLTSNIWGTHPRLGIENLWTNNRKQRKERAFGVLPKCVMGGTSCQDIFCISKCSILFIDEHFLQKQNPSSISDSPDFVQQIRWERIENENTLVTQKWH